MIQKKIVLIIAPVLIALFFCGCETCKLTARGVGQGITQGLPKDTRNTWQSIIQADDWVKKNLW